MRKAMGVLVAVLFGIACLAGQLIPRAYSAGKIKYVYFDCKKFVQLYHKNYLEMTKAQFADWFDKQREKYVSPNTHIIAEGYVLDVVKEDEGYYTIFIAHSKGFSNTTTFFLHLTKLSKSTALQFKKWDKIKFSGKLTFFFSQEHRLFIELEQVRMRSRQK